MVDFIPAAFVIVLTTDALVTQALTIAHRAVKRAFVFVPAGLVVVCCVLGLSDPALTLVVDHVSSSHFNRYIGKMTLSITNNTGATLTPHVMVVVGNDHPVGFWAPAGGEPLEIPAHSTSSVVLRPPPYMAPPKYRETWLVEAFTTSPSTMSATSAYSWRFGR
jgi:hypothetical protein